MTHIVRGRFDGPKTGHRNQPLAAEFPAERYGIDAQGRRVLVGLNMAETREFERLDSQSPSDGEEIGWTFGGHPTTGREKRWLELYTRHNEAWRAKNADAPPATARARLRLT